MSSDALKEQWAAWRGDVAAGSGKVCSFLGRGC